MRVHKASRRAAGRALGVERTVVLLLGTALLVAGLAALAVGFGLLGELRATRPLLDPVVADWLAAEPDTARLGAIVAGVLVFLLSLAWVIRALSPEPRPDFALEGHPGTSVTAAALTAAVHAEAAAIEGVSRVRVRTAGTEASPALRLTVWLHEGTELQHVWTELNDGVLAHARESLGLAELPSAIRLELAASRRQRVR